MKKIHTTLLLLALSLAAFSQNQYPEVKNLQANYQAGSQILTLTFDLADAENDPLEVSVEYSTDAGATYQTAQNLQPAGDIGAGIAAGNGKSITCNMSAFLGGKFFFRVLADDKQTIDIQKLVDEVDSLRLRRDLEFVEGIRHRTTGAAHLQATRDTLEKRFKNLNLTTSIFDATFTGGYIGKNIVGQQSGASLPQNVVIVDAHYDSVSNAPGADDNGSGTVGVLESARVLSKYRFKKSLRFIGFDLEEAGLIGSIRYVTNNLPASDVVEGVFNFEMIGYFSDKPNTQEMPNGFQILFPQAYLEVENNQFRGDFITNVGNTNSSSLVDLFKNSAKQYVPALKVINVVAPGNSTIAPDLRRSDHTPFWDSGRKAIQITDGANFRNECYHTPADTLDGKLSFTFMSNVVKATVAAAATLAQPFHGDWKTVPVEITSSTDDLDPCSWKIATTTSGEVKIFTAACRAFSDAQIEIFDEKGAAVFSEKIDLPADGEQVFQIEKSLPAGVYFLKINTLSKTQVFPLTLK